LGEQDESLDITKILHAVVKHRWLLILPTVLGGLIACAASRILPDRYQSEATILVEHQQVAERLVTPNTTSDLRENLLITKDAILSRTQLLQIIDEFNLYPNERKRLSQQELVALLNSKIDIAPIDDTAGGKSLDEFKISYSGASPHLAQEVTGKLTTLFIQYNDRMRNNVNQETTLFLQQQVEAAAEKLKEEEAQVADFKMKNLGDLPEQQEGNLGILNGFQMELQNTQTSLSRAREQRVYMESLLTQYQDLAASGVATPGVSGVVADPTQAIKARLIELRSQRADLLARYTEKYPDVVKIEEEIKESEDLLAAAQRKVPAPDAGDSSKGTTTTGTTATADSSENNTAIAQLKSQLEANRLEIQNDEKLEKQMQGQIAEYRNRLNLTPVREQQLAELTRNLELSKKNYDDLLSRKNESELATNLDNRQQGERFTTVDQPSFPTKPTWPNHIAIAMGGLAAGLALGGALVFLLGFKDHSLLHEKDLTQFFSFPLMVGLPALVTIGETRRKSRLHVVEWLVGTALGLLVCASEFWVYRKG
jgi:polysaccharide biosynthesis transport protein